MCAANVWTCTLGSETIANYYPSLRRYIYTKQREIRRTRKREIRRITLISSPRPLSIVSKSLFRRNAIWNIRWIFLVSLLPDDGLPHYEGDAFSSFFFLFSSFLTGLSRADPVSRGIIIAAPAHARSAWPSLVPWNNGTLLCFLTYRRFGLASIRGI